MTRRENRHAYLGGISYGCAMVWEYIETAGMFLRGGGGGGVLMPWAGASNSLNVIIYVLW